MSSSCPNKSHPAWKALVEKTGSEIGAYKQYINNNFSIPSIESSGEEKEIKPGVQELFESNTELSNAVYEALGFVGNLNKLKVQDIKTKVSNMADTLENTKKELLDTIKNSTIVDTHKEVMSKVVEGVFNITGSNPLIQDDTDTYKEYNPKKFKDYINYELEDRFNEQQLRNIISNNNAKLLETIFLQHKLALFASEEGVSGLPENLAELELAKITPQQKQQALQLYSNFLSNFINNNFDTIIQDLQTKNILDKKCS